ncbi:NUDIX domain-containing protein [Microbacteriaceae bacterium VKM Ac-2855]|nr:NUDIX domain-containing protein [Microbacteriaceae bacterium VKM Ac-2855]
MSHPEVCVVYVIRRAADGREDVLLGRKRRGLGEGRIVAPGGKLEPGESAVTAAARELAEETGLSARPMDLEPRGRLDYVFPSRPAWSQRSHVFVCRRWSGSLVASAELEARWVPLTDVPYSDMWSDARWWLPAVLSESAAVGARFEFGDDLASVTDSDHPSWRDPRLSAR